MANVILAAWLLAAFFVPVAVGVWAYRRSARRPLLVIPMAIVLVPISWFALVVPVQLLFDAEYSPWLSWVPSVITTLVLVEGIRRLERQLL